MNAAPPLQPTLWRTCRVLANHTRLRILALLAVQEPRTVTAVAEHLRLSLPVASQSLRALEARGLLRVQRTGRNVRYRLADIAGPGPVSRLLSAVRATLLKEHDGVDKVFRLTTAFTHPTRIQIVHLLQSGPLPALHLQASTRLSGKAVHRHLGKLAARGFIRIAEGVCEIESPKSTLRCALLHLAMESPPK